jgi:hypothetical protein
MCNGCAGGVGNFAGAVDARCGDKDLDRQIQFRLWNQTRRAISAFGANDIGHHSTTLSARNNIDVRTSMPLNFAVFRVTIAKKLLHGSGGRS